MDEILDLIESVYEGFPTFSYTPYGNGDNANWRIVGCELV